MPSYPGIYRAKAVQYQSPNLTVYVPQVFGDVTITVTEWITVPETGMGWVMFQGGDPSFPVWVGLAGSGSGGGGGGGTVTDVMWVGPSAPADPTVELWYDTDDPGSPVEPLWVGPEAPIDPSVAWWYDTDEAGAADTRFVNTTGDTMTGPLVLAADPSAAMHPATKQYVDTRLPKSWTAAGVAATIGGTITTVATLNIPAQPVAGLVLIWSFTRINNKTVATDDFTVDINDAVYGVQAQAWYPDSSVEESCSLHCAVPLSASSTRTITVRAQRTSGTGTAASLANLAYNRIDSIWIPN